MKTLHFYHSLKTVVPYILYGTLCGSVTGTFVFFFKLIAKNLEEITKGIYSFARDNAIYIPLVFLGLFLLAMAEFLIHRKIPEVKGGGIPRTEGILRGILSFKWFKTLVGTVVGSFISFFAGLPLGSEGPAVLIGTSLGGMCGKISGKGTARHRYIMSGGAGAGFAVATGAPLSGMLFVIEEVHKKFAPTLILIVSVTVIAATGVNKALCSAFGISDALFDFGVLPEFNIGYIAYLVFAGVIIALFVGLFDASVEYIKVVTVKLKKFLPKPLKLTLLFLIVGAFGLWFEEAVFSGHHLIGEVVSEHFDIYFLFVVLLFRMALLLLATDSGATGGIYIPTLAIGVVISAIVAKLMVYIGMAEELVPLVAVIGMCAFLGGTLRSPFVAIVFFIEITEGLGNVFYAAVAVFVVNIFTTFFDKKPFYDIVLEKMEKAEFADKTLEVKFFEMKVSKEAFVIGKSVRDIMWPHASVIVSISRDHRNFSDTDLDGEKRLHEGDTLILRARTYDEDELKEFLYDLVGREHKITVS